MVTLLHCPFFGNRIEGLSELDWFPFEEGIRHQLIDVGETDLPEGDIFFGPTDRPEVGLPVIIVQGFEMLHTGLERQGFGYPCLKVCVARWLVDVGRRVGVPVEQLVYVPMGIDRSRYRVATPLVRRPARVAMLYSSHRAKGWEVGLEALERAHQEVPELTASVFGTAVPPGGLPEWVTFHHDPAQDVLVEDIYNGASVFLQASDYEGFGLTAVEAMESGCALVTTDNGGSRDYAIPERTALVSEPGDAVALAHGVVTLLRDDVRRRDGRRRSVVGPSLRLGHQRGELEAVLRAYVAEPDRYREAYALDDGDQPWTVSALASPAGGR